MIINSNQFKPTIGGNAMEEIGVKLLEQSVVSGLLVLVVCYVMRHLSRVSEVMSSISNTMASINTELSTIRGELNETNRKVSDMEKELIKLGK